MQIRFHGPGYEPGNKGSLLMQGFVIAPGQTLTLFLPRGAYYVELWPDTENAQLRTGKAVFKAYTEYSCEFGTYSVPADMPSRPVYMGDGQDNVR